ncbi:MAG: transcription-repair coupling factor [Treponema sp.]|nr:transcription-repair coupling factor [Treponema sp.]
MNTLSLPHLIKRTAPGTAGIVQACKNGNFPLEIDASEGAFTALLLAGLYKNCGGNFLVVTATDNEAALAAGDLETAGLKPRIFPWWGTVPYRDAPPFSAVFGERTNILSALAAGNPEIIIASQRAFLNYLPPKDYISGLLVRLKVGGTIDTHNLAETLIAYGYTRVPRVQVQGEFALRGEVLDILMGGDEDACRILFDFDKIESIRPFDPVDQSTGNRKPLQELVLRPLREVVWTDTRIDALSANLDTFEEFSAGSLTRDLAGSPAAELPAAELPIIEELIARKTAAGEEMFFPLAFEKPCLLSDYFGPQDTVFFIDRERLDNGAEALDREYKSLYSRARRDKSIVPAPSRLLADFFEVVKSIERKVSFMTLKGSGEEGAVRLSAGCEPPRSFFGNIDYLRDEFGALSKQGWELAVAAESEVQAARLAELLREENALVGALPFSSGFTHPDIKLMLIQENEIFGRRRRPPKSLKTVRSAAIDTFIELNPGDYVVHINYGIGHFKGIERIRALGHERDYIKLEYQDEETVFVPIEQVNLVQRYIGSEGNPPRLDKLGSKSWENRKDRVKKSVEDIAEKLLVLYSKRRQSQGFAFPKDSEWQTMFEAAFPFEETEDQLRCVEEIKADMESPHPMDRLVCGDVGFGKTEVAVRACFKAVMGGRQAAFLAPTTILAEQHYENFRERFSQFPVKLAMLSRFVEDKQVKKILVDLKNGDIDLLIGTHRIIQKDVVFKNLGFIVIDEEQRFGVKDKERLKELKNNVDCLTLTATPIPRTLHMSLLKIRDMSLLATPPENRHPIETVIDGWNEDRVAAAIRREVERGGQVFYLHNRIQDLQETRIRLEKMVPEMLIETAHGQMDTRELEDVMHRFVHGGFHVLVSTTIIENGIDIPNVNTIIIDRADMYGVSQLYQLRGRVGRSDRVAFAYLFYPENKALSEVAMKRLQVISDFTELGSGFKIAMKDMEIRGAGNLLGREQSGDIYSVGFDLYLRLLDEAVHRLEDEHYEAETETLMELEYSGFIPDAYIDSAQEKMEFYKKVASIRLREELERVYAELLDRFGPLPDEAASLLSLAELRIICRELSISALKEKNGMVQAEFSKVSKIKVERLLRLMKESGGKIKLDPKRPNVVIFTAGNIGLKEKSEFIREKLAALAG